MGEILLFIALLAVSCIIWVAHLGEIAKTRTMMEKAAAKLGGVV